MDSVKLTQIKFDAGSIDDIVTTAGAFGRNHHITEVQVEVEFDVHVKALSHAHEQISERLARRKISSSLNTRDCFRLFRDVD